MQNEEELYRIHNSLNNRKPVMIDVEIESILIQMELNTGASLSVMSLEIFMSLQKKGY